MGYNISLVEHGIALGGQNIAHVVHTALALVRLDTALVEHWVALLDTINLAVRGYGIFSCCEI